MSVTENTSIQQWPWFITQKQTLINITVTLNSALPTGIALPMREGGATSQFDLVSGAIVRSWLWSTATRSSPLGNFSKLLPIVEDFTFISKVYLYQYINYQFILRISLIKGNR